MDKLSRSSEKIIKFVVPTIVKLVVHNARDTLAASHARASTHLTDGSLELRCVVCSRDFLLAVTHGLSRASPNPQELMAQKSGYVNASATRITVSQSVVFSSIIYIYSVQVCR